MSPRRWPAWAQDLALASAFAAAWFTTFALARGHGWYPIVPDSYVVAGLWTTGVLAVRRLAPASTFLVVVVGYPLTYHWGPQTEFHLLPVLVAGYTAASLSRLRPWLVVGVSLATVTVLYAGWAGVGALPDELASTVTGTGALDLSLRIFQSPASAHLNVTRMAFAEFATVVVVLLGRAARRQRETLAALVARNDELERLRAVEAEQVTIAERTRIARELHDVAAHHLTAIVIRAQAADRVAARNPAAAVDAVHWIADSSRDALAAMRQTVRVLRTTDARGAGGAARTPEPDLVDLPDIVERVRAAGLVVDMKVHELGCQPLPHVQLAAVRIIQESLTNVLAHAEATRAVVDVAVFADGLHVVVEDDGRCRPGLPQAVPAASGHGLLGMRERATACGGGLDVARSDLGGWKVSARLPLSTA